ncbi:MAG: cyclic beta 1-2 glucan synthetase [Spirochaetes bacterium RBG_16_49_21]|nr:MAG: cyclic beta 1-2 glucan synthetase [Spirochaetes bacterium RBG_16_49_21]
MIRPRSHFHEDMTLKYVGAEPPLRSVLFSADQMRQHGRILAGSHMVGLKRVSDHLLLMTRLAENEVVLLKVRTMLAEAIKVNHRITPAGEWLLDNFYLIEEHIRTARRHLPKGYSRELPRLRNGPSAGLPRVYDIALETISHGDGRVDPENLSSFVAAYQSVSILKLGELWAIPIMLRLALIENLRRVASRIALDMAEQNRADYWADRMTETAERDPKSLILVIAEMVRSDPPMVSSFVAELTRRLQGQSSNLALPLTWIEQRLLESGSTIKQLVQSEIQQQAADQVSMSNSIGSLRFLGAMDWHEFVETMSVVDQTLGEDPGGFYRRMDFTTRDRYRHVIEEIAKDGGLSEVEVARKAIRLSQEGAAKRGNGDRAAHVGYYLIDNGLAQLERSAGVRTTAFKALQNIIRRFPLAIYTGSITLLTAIFACGLLLLTGEGGLQGWQFGLFTILSFLCATHLSVALVNWAVTLLAVPHPLPRLDYSGGIPPESRTLAVVPTMLMSAQNTEDLIEALEVRFLANRDDNLFFALLTDFLDADREFLPEDVPLVGLARRKIEELNQKYRDPNGDRFFLFHRPRRWNPREKLWMGHERKRGKLADLNSFLRGDARESFSLVVGDTDVLSNVKYVITLDTDTHLPRDSARQFAGAMAHPLNRARYDDARRRIVEGYGIIQPRVAVILQNANRSRYAQLCGSEPGIDPYTRTVSDVYQDLFQEGSYIGKGIYDVDAFERALKGRLPENLVLSHDLLEGCHVRSGLLSDVPLLEEYPSRYSADVNRRQRWIRGDWQIVRWLFPVVPGPGGIIQKNPLSGLSRWKIFDNLRRSLVPLALSFLLILGWTILTPAWLWSAAVIGIICIPSLLISFMDAITKPDDVLWGQHLSAAMNSAGRRLTELAFSLACMPYEAFYSMNAIIRTLWRMLITHTRLLEWNTAADSKRTGRTSLAGSYLTMWIAPVIVAAAAIYLALSGPAALAVAGPILGLWLASPAIAWWISRPLGRKRTRLSAEQTDFLLNLSRKIWAFFETFIGPEDNWLPPDNYQEHPVVAVAHRTSPTNIGFALLANLTAYDFGYVTAGECIERTARSLRTLDMLERHRGHFYNWYDTQSLKPLPPHYISTVDSGNLAAYLLTLRSGLLEIPDKRIVGPRLFDGLRDTLGVFVETLEGGTPPARLADIQKDLEAACRDKPATLGSARRCLDRLATSAAGMADAFIAGADNQAWWWAQTLARQCKASLDELTLLAPWAGSPDMLRRMPDIDEIPTLRQLVRRKTEFLPASDQGPGADAASAESGRNDEIRRLISEAGDRAAQRIAAIERLALRAGELAQMEYDFLYDKERHLLAIGYNVNDRRRDLSYYDLLASEARLCSFTAIAQGQLPQENWFALGRQLTTAGGRPVLLSWSGSMFEYLMPLLVMPAYEHSLLDQSYKAAVARQIEYGRQRGVPWGMSESGYYLIDAGLNYQYRAFGVPGLGLKRGLADDLVIAPYASALALMVAPEEACVNLQRLAAEGFAGRYGLYEAIDFTASRLPHGESNAAVRSFMAHHEGMSFLAMAYLILDRPMQKRFNAEPLFQATALLLQERIPKATALYSHTTELPEIHANFAGPDMPVRVFAGPDTPVPEVQLLSNGRYNVMVTNAGGGYSSWNDIAVTRWREDGTCDNWGSFCYIRDASSGEFWSTAYQPTLKQPKYYEVIFSEGRAEFRRSDHGIDAHTSIVVSPEDDIELRRTRITNRTRSRREIDITSYAEVVLAPHVADALHPALGNLFVQTEIDRERHAILCHRRPRSLTEKTPWFFHLMTAYGANPGGISYETDRTQFIGRWNTPAAPRAMNEPAALSGSEGSVLDPVVAIRYRLTLAPEESVTIDIVSGMGETRSAAVSLVGKYQDRRLADRVFDLAWTHSQVVLRQLNATEADAQLYGHLAGSIIYAHSSLRADPGIIARNRRGQSSLWGYSISGDVPIVLLRIENTANINLARQLIQAHYYWRLKGVAVDLVIWNEDRAGYRQLLHDQIMGLLATGAETNVTDRPGGIFVRSSDQISDEDRILIQTAARAIISDDRGTLAEQINRRGGARKPVPQLVPARSIRAEPSAVTALPRPDLMFFNGYGGFTPDGREYIITTAHGQVTPAPWVNVLANLQFGTVVSESGHAYTWAENAHEFRITPWYNDPVSDSSGEAFYIRDEERGHYWSPMPLPCRGATPYVTRHGFGYSVFEHTERGISSEAWVYVALDASVKFTVLKITNNSGRPRRLSVTGYAEWVLGDLRPKSAMHVVTELDPASGALFARNGYSIDFAGRVAFFDTDDTTRTLSGDRTEFLGRNGTLRDPAAMTRVSLSGRVGAALDPCAAIQVPFDLADGQDREIIFRLGVGRDADDAGNLVGRFRGSYAARGALEAVWRYWNHTLGAVQVETPDQSLDMLTNGWLLYQTLACRIWARSGYYQSGGAFGFRDQLQDVMALIHAEPRLARDHILLCAARQFTEGDVQHWWHPPSGRGVRTHCSDDFLWLPMATIRYVLSTGDTGVLDEPVAFIEGRPVKADEDSYYDFPNRSRQMASLYDHCVRAILRGESYGVHGLPLIGSGDWNDGMNIVGKYGKGESVWLGFFFYEVLMGFTAIAQAKDDKAFVEHCRSEASMLRQKIEQSGWDGGWYRRAYFDDGTPLGSAGNPECQIDSIVQSWSVLSGAGDAARSRMSMEAVDKRLVRREHALIQLLEPPFDASDLDPGYIKGYVPGVRENGGQYTHAAVWAAMAFAKSGDSRRAWELTAMINPVNHARSPQGVATYKVEPYVVAADVYALSPHTGRGGWTWYTGSAGWMYRLVVESLLGLRLETDKLRFEPCLPDDWDAFKMHYRYRETIYHITIRRMPTGGGANITLDGVPLSGTAIPLIDDRREHSVDVRIGVASG